MGAPESSAMRALVMANYANGFVEAALRSYEQVEALAREDARCRPREVPVRPAPCRSINWPALA